MPSDEIERRIREIAEMLEISEILKRPKEHSACYIRLVSFVIGMTEHIGDRAPGQGPPSAMVRPNNRKDV